MQYHEDHFLWNFTLRLAYSILRLHLTLVSRQFTQQKTAFLSRAEIPVRRTTCSIKSSSRPHFLKGTYQVDIQRPDKSSGTSLSAVKDNSLVTTYMQLTNITSFFRGENSISVSILKRGLKTWALKKLSQKADSNFETQPQNVVSRAGLET